MRTLLVALALALGSAHASAASNVSVSIGINVPAYPTLQRIPGYPVYYAPALHANYFFYDGLYWVFDGYDWYASAWYNGPWQLVSRYEVPAYVLRVPVRYYRARPAYFSTWYADAPPRWDLHWGATWSERRAGWDRWTRTAVPAPAPLPVYQRAYSGSRYPTLSEQLALQSERYSYRPRDSAVRQRYEELRAQAPGYVRKEVKEVRKEARKEAKEVRKEAKEASKEARKDARSLDRQQARVERDRRAAEQRFDSVREERRARLDNAPPPHAQAKGWPGKGHDRDRVAQGPPEHAQAKGWPGRGHDRDRDGVDDHAGRGKGRGHDR